MTTTTTGFGAVTLAAPVAGHISFSQAGLRDGDDISYAILDGAGSELGRGIYSISGPTLTRNVLQSTNNNEPLDLSGSAEVFISEMAGGGTDVRAGKRDVLPIAESPNPPGLEAWRTSTLSIPDIAHTTITMSDFVFEQGLEMESSSVIKFLRYSAVEWYDFFFTASFAANASNNRVIRFQVRDINDGTWTDLDIIIIPASQNGLDTNISTVFRYVKRSPDEDAVRFQAYQDSGGALDLKLFLLNVVLIKSGADSGVMS